MHDLDPKYKTLIFIQLSSIYIYKDNFCTNKGQLMSNKTQYWCTQSILAQQLKQRKTPINLTILAIIYV